MAYFSTYFQKWQSNGTADGRTGIAQEIAFASELYELNISRLSATSSWVRIPVSEGISNSLASNMVGGTLIAGYKGKLIGTASTPGGGDVFADAVQNSTLSQCIFYITGAGVEENETLLYLSNAWQTVFGNLDSLPTKTTAEFINYQDMQSINVIRDWWVPGTNKDMRNPNQCLVMSQQQYIQNYTWSPEYTGNSYDPPQARGEYHKDMRLLVTTPRNWRPVAPIVPLGGEFVLIANEQSKNARPRGYVATGAAVGERGRLWNGTTWVSPSGDSIDFTRGYEVTIIPNNQAATLATTVPKDKSPTAHAMVFRGPALPMGESDIDRYSGMGHGQGQWVGMSVTLVGEGITYTGVVNEVKIRNFDDDIEYVVGVNKNSFAYKLY